MPSYRFKQVDVFTHESFRGNPVAVVFADPELPARVMQRIASWTNLSETTFVLPSEAAGADYRLRIFHPREELPFAGHPSVGSAHAVLEAGLAPTDSSTLHQDCLAGVIPLRVVATEGAARRIFVRMPEPGFRPLAAGARDRIAAALGCAPADGAPALAVDVGPVWLVVELSDAEQVRALRPDLAAIAALSTELEVGGVTVFGRNASGDVALEVRSFAPALGIAEDPVCGSGNGSVAAYLFETGRAQEQQWIASQGGCLGREGRVEVRVGGGGREIEVGGPSVTCIEGEIRV